MLPQPFIVLKDQIRREVFPPCAFHGDLPPSSSLTVDAEIAWLLKHANTATTVPAVRSNF
jgi:hypothetical protein